MSTETKKAAGEIKSALELLEEDDEFEEFEGVTWEDFKGENEENTLWQDDWEDDDANDDFVNQLRAQLQTSTTTNTMVIDSNNVSSTDKK